MEKAFSAMASYNVPMRFWGDAVEYAAFTGEPFDVSVLVPFYAPGVYHVSKEERNAKGSIYNEY